MRLSQNLCKARATNGNAKNVNGFFDLVEAEINKLNLKNKPQNIFNVDETNFSCDQNKSKIFCRKGTRANVLTGDNEKASFTVQVNYI